jgi:hypothetical protein
VFDVLLNDTDGDESKPADPTAADGEMPATVSRPERDGREVSADEIERLLDDAADLDPRCDGLCPSLPPGHDVEFPSGRRIIFHGIVSGAPGGGAAATRDLLFNASNIRRIAIAATRKRMRIRWFDPETVPSTPGPPGHLQVLSATEVRAIRRTGLSPRDVLRLTQVNRDSLVLYSPADGRGPGCSFLC